MRKLLGDIANTLQIIGFNYRTDPIIGSIAGVVLAALRTMETISPTQVILTFVYGTVGVIALLAIWRVLRRTFWGGDAGGNVAAPVAPITQSGDGAVMMTAKENSKIQYTVINNYFHIKEEGADRADPPKGASLKFNPILNEILTSANVSSLTDEGGGLYTLTFYKALNDENATGHSLTASTQILHVLPTGAELKFDRKKALDPVINVKFGEDD